MLNTCPKDNSCGASLPMWTDEAMPVEIGKESLIYAYEVAILCKIQARAILVMRCSLDTDHDYIYKYQGEYVDTCSSAFCGMT